MPLFFNPVPGSVERTALRALRTIAANEQAPDAEAELGRLGGAALPFLLPALDSLSPVIIAGAGVRFRLPRVLRSIDLAPLCMELLGLPMRYRPGMPRSASSLSPAF